jgi:hypothetical protein
MEDSTEDIFTTDARADPSLYGGENDINKLVDLVKTEDFHIALIGGIGRMGTISLLLLLLKILTNSRLKEKYNVQWEYFPLYIGLDAVNSLEVFHEQVGNGQVLVGASPVGEKANTGICSLILTLCAILPKFIAPRNSISS